MKPLPALLLGLPLVPALACKAHAHVPGPREEVLVLDLTGLRWPVEWPRRVRSALRHVPGVECAHVDLDAGAVTVACEKPCDRAALVEAIEKKGYGAKVR